MRSGPLHSVASSFASDTTIGFISHARNLRSEARETAAAGAVVNRLRFRAQRSIGRGSDRGGGQSVAAAASKSATDYRRAAAVFFSPLWLRRRRSADCLLPR